MKSICAMFGTVLCVVMVTACTTDDQPATAEAQSGEVVEMGTVVYVPPELSFEQPEGTFVGNQFTATAAACHVTLLFCRDARFGNLPSFCQNGGCSGPQGASIARSLCRSVCGHIDCNTLVQVLPNRPGC